METSKDATYYNFQNADSLGCLIFFESKTIHSDTTLWGFTLLDTNLVKKRNFIVPLPAKSQFQTSCYADGTAWFLFFQQKNKKSSPVAVLLAINLTNYSINIEKNNALGNANIYKISKLENLLILNAKEKKDETIWVYHLLSKRLYELETPFPIVSQEFQKMDTFNHKILMGFNTNDKGDAIFMLYELDENGVIEQQHFFPKINDYQYNSARLTVIDSTTSLIIGTYNMTQNRYVDNLHSGYYTMLFKEESISLPKFYNFTQLELKDSTLRKNSKLYNLNLQLLVGNLTDNQQQFTLTTEIYYPEYSQSGYDYYDSYSLYTPSSSIFLGYRYINAYITTFDKNGDLLWHHYLPFENILTKRLITRVNVFFENDNAVIYYPYNYTLTYARVHGYDILDKLTTVPIETLHNKDIIEYSKKLEIENWYKNNFLIYGYQFIKNNSKTYKSKRYVFFINKLKYQ